MPVGVSRARGLNQGAAMAVASRDIDGGWAWVVLCGSFMNLLLASGIGFVSGIFQKVFLEEFDQSVAFTAWVTALFSSFMQMAGPLSGLLTSVTNCRVSVIVGGVLFSVGLAASSLATSLHFLLISFGLVAGIGLGLMYSPSIVVVNFFFDRRRTVIVGIALSASGIGIIGAPVLSRFLIDAFTWRETMVILAGLAAHTCVFGALMFPLHEPRSKITALFRRCGQTLCSGNSREKEAQNSCCDAEKREGVFSTGESLLAESSAKTRRGEDEENCANNPNCSLREKDRGEGERNIDLANRHSDSTEQTPCLKDFEAESQSRDQIPDNSVTAPTCVLVKRPVFSSLHDLNSLQPKQQPSLATSLVNVGGHLCSSHRPQNGSSKSRIKSPLTSENSPCFAYGGSSSKADVRAVSTYSSIQTLHSVGFTPPDKIVASVVDVWVDEAEGGEWSCGAFCNAPFLSLCVNLILSNAACGIFNIHLPAFSQQRGLDDHDITFVLAMDGVAVFLSRVLVGALGHDEKVDQLVVYFGLHLISSFVQMSLPLATSVWSVTVMVMMMGTYYGSVYSLLTPLTICIVGLQRLAFAFGVEMVCAGAGFLVAPPLAGWVVDMTGDYNNSMYFGGGLMLMSALVVLPMSCGRRRGSPPIGYRPPDDVTVSIEDMEGEPSKETRHGRN